MTALGSNAASSPPVLSTATELRSITSQWRCHGLAVGLVATMGSLHRGHLSLVAAARAQCDRVVVSIFVNPLQFGPGDDFQRYPRDARRDRDQLSAAAVDAIYMPAVSEVYPPGFSTMVSVALPGLDRFEGAARPGHFQGVATVVAKLFAATGPARAYFSEKDAQQAVMVSTLARDLDLGVEVEVCPIVRDPDGLALSSRNAYLLSEQRPDSRLLSRWLREAQVRFDKGQTDSGSLRRLAGEIFREGRWISLEYAEVVDPLTFVPVELCTGSSRLLIAARLGGIRLIDAATLGGQRVP
ncbi:MAG TPA: pantoate--beta-alanine ligase [Candidatus Dormibacteraeota bacterium]|nr:pantoate--beta-alanine ligase [Candidatus Dormibacteraeota bacterium]